MDNLETLRQKQNDLYVRIAGASGDELDSLLDEVWDVETEIGAIENPPVPAISKDEFESRFNVEKKYQMFHDEYGDAASFYSDYLDYHYKDYLSHVANGWFYDL